MKIRNMKRITKELIFTFSFILFLLTGCELIQGNEKQKSGKTGKLEITAEKAEYLYETARTILPNTDITEFTNFVLSMERDDGKVNAYSFEDYNDLTSRTIGIETGNWTFVLKSGDFEGTLNQTIVEGSNNLSFCLEYVGDSGSGKVDILFSTPNDDRIKTIKCGLLNIVSERETVDFPLEELEITKNEEILEASYIKESVPKGFYILKWNVYADSECKVLLYTKEDVIQIEEGYLSSEVMTFNDEEELYTITYNLGEGGSFSEDVEIPYVFSRISDFDLPNYQSVICEGKYFEGWYDSADYTGNRITTVKNGTETNLSFYAKWIDSIVFSVEKNEESVSLDDYEIVELNPEETKDLVYFLAPGFTYKGKWIDYNTTGETLLSQNGYTSIDATIHILKENEEVITELDDNDDFEFTVSEDGFYTIRVTSVSEAKGNCAFMIYKDGCSYSIQYNLNGGSFSSYCGEVQTEYKAGEEVLLPQLRDLQRPYCMFKGWYETEDCDTEPVTRITAGTYGNKVFYAAWEGELFNIAYELNGGVTEEENPDYFTVLDSITLKNPVKTGYCFDGWYGTADFSDERIETVDSRRTGDIVLYAKWLKECTVSYTSNYGTAPQNITVVEGSELTAEQLPVLETEGLDFFGWYIGEEKIEEGYTISSSITITAEWGTYVGQEINWQVTSNGTYYFVQSGNTWTSNNGNVHSSTAQTTWTLELDDSTDYTIGYTVSSEGNCDKLTIILDDVTIVSGISGDVESSYSITLSAGSHTLSASYTKDGSVNSGNDCATITLVGSIRREGYLISYETGVEGNEISPTTVIRGEGLTENNLPQLTIEGRRFCGWYFDTECTQEVEIGHIPTENITLTAKLELINYTVTYNLYGGTNSENNPSVYTIETETITLSEPSKEGYYFDGWYSSDDYFEQTKKQRVEKGSIGNLVLYAKWIKEYTVNYTSEYGTAPQSIKICEGIHITAEQLPVLEAEGKYFAGWYIEETKLEDGNYAVTEDVTLTARWLDICTVSYVTDYGTVPQTIEVGQGTQLTSAQLPSLKVEGWSFRGWYTDSSYTQKAEVEYAVNSSITFYAKWERNIDGFVFVEGGTVVGSDSYNQKYTGAFPAGRTVTLSDYYMSPYEVTKELYKEVMEGNSLGLTADPSYSTLESSTYYKIAAGETDSKRAVEDVSWYDAVYFCNLYSQKQGLEPVYTITGISTSTANVNGTTVKYISSASVTADHTKNGYRLPTEAEWEYAARGGKETYGTTAFANYFAGTTTTDYLSYTNTALDGYAWYCYNICNKGITTSSYPDSGAAGYGAHQVGLLKANALGLYDMSGNVWEWCYDWYSSSLSSGTVTNPTGASSGSYRVGRGGSWGNLACGCSVSSRGSSSPYSRGDGDGFRLVRSSQ